MWGIGNLARSGGRGDTHRSTRSDEVAASDRRWLLATYGIFGATLLVLAGLYQLYSVSGPHDEVTLFLRDVTRIAHWLLPGF